MKVAIIYDRINKMGGAERVLIALSEIYPQAIFYSLVYNPETASWARSLSVKATFFNRIKFFRTHHEILAPVAGMAFETFNLNQYDLVISVTSAEAKAVITNPNTVHLCYCLTPTRYLWSSSKKYKKYSFSPALFKLFLPHLRSADLVYASRPDQYLSISNEVRSRLKKYYHKKSSVIYPPINYRYFSAKSPKKNLRRYYLVVSRLVPYKKVDLVVEVFKNLTEPLIVVGTGSELKQLKNLAKDNKNIRFLGSVSDQKLRSLYQGAKAIIAPQFEDFGLVPLEAAACGTPTIAFAKGGNLETVQSGVTGLFFHQQSVRSLSLAIKNFTKLESTFKSANCKNFAKQFSLDRFKTHFSAKVMEIWQNQQFTSS